MLDLLYLPPQHRGQETPCVHDYRGERCVGYCHLWVKGVYLTKANLAGYLGGTHWLVVDRYRYPDDSPTYVRSGNIWPVCLGCYRNYCFQKVWQELRTMP